MLKICIFLLLILFNAIFLQQIVKNNKIVKNANYLFSLVFIIISLPLWKFNNHWLIFILTFLLMLYYREITLLNNINNKKQRVLNTGLLIGLMMVVDHGLVVFYPISLFAILYYKEFNWKHAIIQFIGLLIPFSIYYILLVLKLEPSNFMYTSQPNFSELHILFTEYPIHLSILSIISLISGYELFNKYYKKTEHAKKGFIMLISITILIVVQIILSNSFKWVYFLCVPLTIIISNYLMYVNRVYFPTFLLGLWYISFLFEFFL